MSGRPYVLAETTWKAVKNTHYEVVMLPWGATEAHNYHLPYGTDVIESDYIAIESARLAWERGAKVVVLPTVPFGTNTGQLRIKLDINLNPSTHMAVLRDVVDSLSRQGFRKLVILNGHGGNDFRQIIRELFPLYPQMLICNVNWWLVVDGDRFFKEVGDHGGEMETSNMLHIAPGLLLPIAEAGDGKERKFRLRGLREGVAWTQREWTKATADTGVGNPKEASLEKGQAYLKATTETIADFLIELAACDPNDLYEKP